MKRENCRGKPSWNEISQALAPPFGAARMIAGPRRTGRETAGFAGEGAFAPESGVRPFQCLYDTLLTIFQPFSVLTRVNMSEYCAPAQLSISTLAMAMFSATSSVTME